MGYVAGLKCRECAREYDVRPIYVCEYCFGPLEVAYDYPGIRGAMSRGLVESRSANLWRYKELMPIDGEPRVGLDSGYTPLMRAENLGRAIGLDNLYIKDDTVVHPTLSFKDRVVAVALTKAIEFGFDTVACASTGNLAHAVSAHGARAGLKRFIFIPASLEPTKIVASNVYGPNLVAVDGSYDDVNRLCSEIANRHRWAFVNINIRPFYAEGSKSQGFEILQQLGWRAPDCVVVPCASGSLLTKIHKSFKEAVEVGLIEGMDTKVFAAQASGCSPISTAIQAGTDVIRPVKPATIARSLAIGNPADGYYATRIVEDTGGYGELASDEEIVEAMQLLARTEGVFAETAGGVTLACTIKLARAGRIRPGDLTVICITGNGLKTQEALVGHVREVPRIGPGLGEFEALLKTMGGNG